MTVRAEDRRTTLGGAHRPEEESSDEVAGVTLEIDLLDGETPPLDATMNDRIEGRSRGHRPESGGNKHLAAEARGAALPRLAGRRDTHREIAVQIHERPEPDVVGSLRCR
jgi:hypothetical protein